MSELRNLCLCQSLEIFVYVRAQKYLFMSELRILCLCQSLGSFVYVRAQDFLFMSELRILCLCQSLGFFVYVKFFLGRLSIRQSMKTMLGPCFHLCCQFVLISDPTVNIWKSWQQFTILRLTSYPQLLLGEKQILKRRKKKIFFLQIIFLFKFFYLFFQC